MQPVLRLCQCEVHVHVIRRQLHCDLIFTLGLPELRLLAISFSTSEVNGRDILHSFRSEICLTQRGFRTSQLQVSECKAQMSFPVIRTDLESRFEILNCTAGLAQ